MEEISHENKTLSSSKNTQEDIQSAPKTNNKGKVWGIIGLLIFCVILIAAVYFLLQPATPTDKIRDIFIIFMALESLLVGIVLIILVVQIAILINLIQNEVKPILTSTNETVQNLKGTASFLSDHLVEPVIKLNEYLAGVKKLFDLFRPGK